MMFASIALAKSKQNTWILFFNELFIKLMTQFIKSFSTKTGITVSLIEHFYKIAKQKR
jgi:hypothetical protein